MADRVNFFTQFKSKQDHHEDLLTRALLIVLRLIPDAHTEFLSLVGKARETGNPRLPSPSRCESDSTVYRTQTASVPPAKRYLSLLLTDHEFAQGIRIGKSRRGHVYDGVITYGDDWCFIIENKPSHKNVWTDQLRPNLGDSANAYLEPRAVVLEWKAIISSARRLLESRRLSRTQEHVVTDFLDFVFDNFAFLNPYDRVGACRGNEHLLTARCRQVMERIAPGRVGHHPGWKDYMQFGGGGAGRISLAPEIQAPNRWSMKLIISPGDTIRQARALYQRLDKKKLLALSGQGWSIRTNLHIAHMSKNLAWASGDMSVRKYVDFWQEHMSMVCQWPLDDRSTAKKCFRLWSKKKLLAVSDIEEFESKTIGTNRKTMNVCPGLHLEYTWGAAEANALDGKGRFVSAVRDKLLEAFSCWGQSLPDAGAE